MVDADSRQGSSPPRFCADVVAAALVGWALAWSLTTIPVLAIRGGFAGGYAPFVWRRRRNEQATRARSAPGRPRSRSSPTRSRPASPSRPRSRSSARPGRSRCGAEFARFHARLRTDGLAAALDGLAATRERTADTVALLLRAGLLELPAGGLAPLLRELSVVLAERFEAREKARYAPRACRSRRRSSR